jgi:hypothetical protein
MPAALLMTLFACGGAAPGTDSAAAPDETGSTGSFDDATEPVLLDDVAWLARASLDLRGVRPDIDELEAVAEGTTTVPGFVDVWLQDPRFPARMAWLWNDVLHTAVWADDYSRFGELTPTEWQAIGQEPLQLIAAVIEEDRAFSDVLTSPLTRVDGTLAALWGLEHPSEDWGWAAYTDGRPEAGLLSTNTLWLRYTADAVNVNRTRANSTAALFLCADFLERDGGFSFAVSAEALEDVEQAVAEQPACLTCHAALDPLASFFGGFAQRSVELPQAQYLQWSQHTADWFAARIPPAYFGLPGADVGDLGALMAADPRFAACAAGRFYEGLHHVAPSLETRTALGVRFKALGLDVRSLVQELIEDPAYRADDGRLLRSEQLHEALADLLEWGDGGDLLDELGPLSWSAEHRVLGGGTDDDTVLLRNPSPGVGLQVLLEWTARQAVGPALDAALADEASGLLLDGLPEDADAARDQLVDWHARFLSRPVAADSAEITSLLALWEDAGGAGLPEQALAEVLAVLIRHPAQVIY